MQGALRFGVNGYIEMLNYDEVSNTLGPLSFKLPMLYDNRYGWHDLLELDPNFMLRTLLQYDSAIAVVMSDLHWSVDVIFPNGILRVRDDVMEHRMFTRVPVGMAINPTISTGFVRTNPPVDCLDIPPYRLFADREGRYWYKGKIRQLPHTPVMCTDMSLYKDIINSDRDIRYMSDIGPEFI